MVLNTHAFACAYVKQTYCLTHFIRIINQNMFGAAGDSAASPHSSLPGKIISGEANGKHPAILQDISAVYLTSPKHFYKARRY